MVYFLYVLFTILYKPTVGFKRTSSVLDFDLDDVNLARPSWSILDSEDDQPKSIESKVLSDFNDYENSNFKNIDSFNYDVLEDVVPEAEEIEIVSDGKETDIYYDESVPKDFKKNFCETAEFLIEHPPNNEFFKTQAAKQYFIEKLDATCYQDPNSKSNLCPPGGCTAEWDLSGINGYGCWCNFGDNLMKGEGSTVNELDSICRKYQLCLRCAKYDGKNSENSCDPKTDTYNSVHTQQGVNCTAANPDNDCGTHLCSCNFQFYTALISTLWEKDYSYSDEYLHSNGWSSDQCTGKITSNEETISCCGFYPHRYPFSLSSSTKQCCNHVQVYNPATQQCCNGQNVRDIGSC